MSPSWRPDDSFHDIEDGEVKGVRRAREALRKGGVKVGRRILTSRDAGMDVVRRDLPRGRMPRGFQSWQLPINLGPAEDILSFVSVGAPDAAVPRHTHKLDLFRVVISGSLIHNGKELTQGDWMFVPAGVPYAMKAGSLGVIHMHHYLKQSPPSQPKSRTRRAG